MSVRILYLKKAYIADEHERRSLVDDMAAFENILTSIFPTMSSEVCSITEDGEWLMHGRRVNPQAMLLDYEYVCVFIHGADSAYDRASAELLAHSKNNFFIYDVSDRLFHNAERLHGLIKHNKLNSSVKFPHQRHANMKAYNDNITPVEDIVRAHIRELFLPVHIVETDHRKQIPLVHTKTLAYTPNEFATILHDRRHGSDSLTFRENITGPTVYVIAVPGFRKQKVYTTIPLHYKEVNGTGYWDPIRLTDAERKSVAEAVEQVSTIAFSKQVVVYALAIHPKRGVFIQSTAPLFDYMIHHPGFFMAAATESGILPTELFVLSRNNS